MCVFNSFPTSEIVPALLGDAQTPPRTFAVYSHGKRNAENCRKVPLTCTLLERVTMATSCKHGETKFLVVPPKSHVPPHTGQTNTRLVVLVGLSLGEGELTVRVAEEKRLVIIYRTHVCMYVLYVRSYVYVRMYSLTLKPLHPHRVLREGEVLVFDDSFEQEVWFTSLSPGLVLSMEVWHPDLSTEQRKRLSPIH